MLDYWITLSCPTSFWVDRKIYKDSKSLLTLLASFRDVLLARHVRSAQRAIRMVAQEAQSVQSFAVNAKTSIFRCFLDR